MESIPEQFFNLSRTCGYDIMHNFYQDFLSMFYILPIQDSIKDNIHDVPNYEVMLFPIIGMLIMIEQLIRLYQRKELSRFEDCVINVGSAFIFTLARVFMYMVVIELFDYIHRNYAIIDLELHSVWTWLFSLLMVEFVYYWTHRALHEFNILWAAHQFHHMAEDINITTTVRDSVVDLIIYDLFPIPLAFLLPAQILAVHIQFSLIYQVWLHNDVVGHLGPLEYIINTPRQHRVHHGKNPYCIDKNYGALLMIWDRMFGTYQEEDTNEKIVFGCVSPTPNTYDPMYLQFGYYKDVWNKFHSVEGFGNKMSALFKGPGWGPGKPRLGLISDVPPANYSAPKYTYTPYVAVWKKVYIYVHSFIVVMGFYLMADHPLVRFSPLRGFLCMMYVIFTLTSFGAIFDNRWFSDILEICRCISYLAFDYYAIHSVDWNMGNNMLFLFNNSIWIVRTLHLISIIFWMVNFAVRIYSTGKLFDSAPTKEFNCIINNNSDNNSDSNKTVDVELKCGNGNCEKSNEKFETNIKKSPNNISAKIYLVIALLTTASGVVFFSVYFLSINSCKQLLESAHY